MISLILFYSLYFGDVLRDRSWGEVFLSYFELSESSELRIELQFPCFACIRIMFIYPKSILSQDYLSIFRKSSLKVLTEHIINLLNKLGNYC